MQRLELYLRQQQPPGLEVANDCGRDGRLCLHRWVHLQAGMQLSGNPAKSCMHGLNASATSRCKSLQALALCSSFLDSLTYHSACR